MYKRLLLLSVLFFNLLIWNQPATAQTFESQTTSDFKKSWHISFNAPVKLHVNLDQLIVLTDSSGREYEVTIQPSVDKKRLTIIPSEPYLMGKVYTISIDKNVESEKGQKLKEEVRMDFTVEGEYIQSVEAVANPLATNVKVQGTRDIYEVTVTINGSSETLHRYMNNQFRRGIQGLMDGDLLQIKAYDENKQLIDEQYYQIGS